MDRTLSLAPVDLAPVDLAPVDLAPVDLAAGSGWRMREAGPQDASLIREFVCGLSVQTQYFRFFTAVAPPSPGLLRALAGGGAGRSDILIAIDDDGAVIGHGMAVDADRAGVKSADIGLVVADRWQGLGLGTGLLGLLVDRAVARGVAALLLDVLPTNTRMLRIIERRWPAASRSRSADSIAIRAGIGPADPGLTEPGPAATAAAAAPAPAARTPAARIPAARIPAARIPAARTPASCRPGARADAALAPAARIPAAYRRGHQDRSHQDRSHQDRSHQDRSHQDRSHQDRSHQDRSHPGPGSPRPGSPRPGGPRAHTVLARLS
jgi:GNAT superfamily N-acetyltransferase